MQNSEKNEDVSERLQNINDHFSYNLYENVCRSLFEKDKLLFSALLSIRVLMSQCLLSEDSVAFLLTGGVGVSEAKVEPPENRYGTLLTCSSMRYRTCFTLSADHEWTRCTPPAPHLPAAICATKKQKESTESVKIALACKPFD